MARMPAAIPTLRRVAGDVKALLHDTRSRRAPFGHVEMTAARRTPILRGVREQEDSSPGSLTIVHDLPRPCAPEGYARQTVLTMALEVTVRAGSDTGRSALSGLCAGWWAVAGRAAARPLDPDGTPWDFRVLTRWRGAERSSRCTSLADPVGTALLQFYVATVPLDPDSRPVMG